MPLNQVNYETKHMRWWRLTEEGWKAYAMPVEPFAGAGASARITGIGMRAFGVDGPTDVRPPPGTPGTIRYDDIYTAGMTLQQVFTAASNSTPNKATRTILTFPADVFQFSNFSQASSSATYGFGLWIPVNVGIAGSGKGVGGTSFQMVPNSSTKQAPTSGTNELQYWNIQHTGSNPVVPVVANWYGQHFSLIGTEQGHLYNGFKIQHANGGKLVDVYVEGMPGNNSAPPGETFAINVNNSADFTCERVEVDGRRTRQGGTLSIGASPWGANSAARTILRDCYFHDSYASMPTFWQSPGFQTFGLRSVDNRVGVNHENTKGGTHTGFYMAPYQAGYNGISAGRPNHMTMRNDPTDPDGNGTIDYPYGGDGIFNLIGGTWRDSTASGSGHKFVVATGPRSQDGIHKKGQLTTPRLMDANGNSIQSQLLEYPNS